MLILVEVAKYPLYKQGLVFHLIEIFMLIPIVYFYLHERQMKIFLYRILKQTNDLESWKNMLQKHIPSSFAIIKLHKDKKMLHVNFINQHTLKIFNLAKPDEFLAVLDRIAIETTELNPMVKTSPLSKNQLEGISISQILY